MASVILGSVRLHPYERRPLSDTRYSEETGFLPAGWVRRCDTRTDDWELLAHGVLVARGASYHPSLPPQTVIVADDPEAVARVRAVICAHEEAMRLRAQQCEAERDAEAEKQAAIAARAANLAVFSEPEPPPEPSMPRASLLQRILGRRRQLPATNENGRQE